MKTKNYGFIFPVMQPEDYVLGGASSLDQEILQTDSNWEKYLPSTEKQYINFETYGCTDFAITNCFEILKKRIYGETDNFSDRFLGINAGTKPPGNDPLKVAQAAKSGGFIPETLLPYSGNSWQEYYSFKGGDEIKCRAKGQEFLRTLKPGYEWVYQGMMNNKKLREALKYSPVAISVSAWQQNDKGEYVSQGQNNHYTVLYKMDEKDRKYVFDSYEPYYKVLSADHDIQIAQRFNLVKNTEPVNVYTPILKGIIETLKSIISYLQKNVSKTIGRFVGVPTIIKDYTKGQTD
jgi:hypothetical protein